MHADPYLDYVYQLHQSGNPVYACADIRDTDGRPILNRGDALNASSLTRLRTAMLERSWDHYIQIRRTLGQSTLTGHFKELFDQHEDIKQLHNDNGYATVFASLIHQRHIHPKILQTLTVMQTVMPDSYRQSLFCGWFASLIGWRAGLDKDDVFALLVAGLVRDVGLLHIDPDILNSYVRLEAGDWQRIEEHVMAGMKLLREITDLPETLVHAVMEHHEVADGSGYPQGLYLDDISLPGRILGMADSITAIRMKRFAQDGRTLGDLGPYLQLNADTHSQEVYRLVHAVLRRSQLEMRIILPDVPIGEYMQRVGRCLYFMMRIKDQCSVLIRDFWPWLEYTPLNKSLKTLLLSLVSMERTSLQSGLLTQDIIEWLGKPENRHEQGALREINEIVLLAAELKWQMKNTLRKIQTAHADQKTAAVPNNEICEALFLTAVRVERNLDRIHQLECF